MISELKDCEEKNFPESVKVLENNTDTKLLSNSLDTRCYYYSPLNCKLDFSTHYIYVWAKQRIYFACPR